MLKDWAQLKIGYTAYSNDYSMPSDRRRFVGYARHKGLNIEKADINGSYDIVFLTYVGDLHKWIQKKKTEGDKFKLIFELQDFYLAEPFSFKTVFRGVVKYLTGGSSKLYLDYKKLLKEVCEVADAVVCTSEEQKQAIRAYNKNVHICLDFFEEEIQQVKSDFSVGRKLKLVWEGQAHMLRNVLIIKDVLNELKDDVELHIVTDLHYYKYLNQYVKKEAADMLSTIKCDKYFYSWEKATFNKHIIACDLAIIPIATNNALYKGKPENKLILFWLMGMPTLTSATPAYSRSMEKCGFPFDMATLPEWKEKIQSYKSMTVEQRLALSEQSYQFAKQYYNKNQIGEMWDRVLMAI